MKQELRERMQELGIDIHRTEHILAELNRGAYDKVQPVVVKDIPEVDGIEVVTASGELSLRIPEEELSKHWAEIAPEIDPIASAQRAAGALEFSYEALKRLGTALYPRTAFGVLNGGSATSYADEKKNRGLSEPLYKLLAPVFEPMADRCRGKAKGLTPAFVQPDGTEGPTFLELKMRGLLIRAMEHQIRQPVEPPSEPLEPFFQMTSVHNNDEVDAAYKSFKTSPLLDRLIRETGIDMTDAATGIQPMLAALTHSQEGSPRHVFESAYGKEHEPLGLPGGHGQNFSVLADIYRELQADGKRLAYLSNVDNLGATVDPATIAYTALTGRQAAFDFAFRTAVDVKGGILVRDARGRLNCADIGPAVSPDEVARAEAEGKAILFNCATGLFNLNYLTHNIESIVDHLPMRISDQDKDAGRYAQAEQVTWEVLGLLDRPLVFGVDKYRRFLAAKLLLETLMTSGISLDHPDYPRSSDPAKDLLGTARQLNAGLHWNLEHSYGMKRSGDRWVPKSVDELRSDLSPEEET
ncbi:MAG: UTP--glucose-1-phosphate uridylyltransferase [Spirochaetia bacterium]